MKRRPVRLIGLALLSAHCSGSPTMPAAPPPPNIPPVITALSASLSRIEVGSQVDLSAIVEDAESTSDGLRFEWAADAGAFVGTGPHVKWQAPTLLATPADYVLRLTVVEAYQALNNAGQLVTQEHRIAATATVRVHNSPKELGDMGLRFLGYFANSTISAQACVVEFSDSCSGKAAEISDIEQNRHFVTIVSHQFGSPRVTYEPGSNEAVVRILTSITDKIRTCDGWPPGWGPCTVDTVAHVTFDARLPSVYEQGRWWICESLADATNGSSAALRYLVRPLIRQ